MTSVPCEYCRLGYIPPYDRYERLGAATPGPVLLWRCRLCGTLWLEELRLARRIDATEARELFGSVETEPMLERFKPENATETAVAEARAGTRDAGELPDVLAAARLFVSSRAEVMPDGGGFEPLLMGEADAPLVAAFTAPGRATLHRARAEYLLEMDGDSFLRRLPPGYGAVVNPGYDAQFVVDAGAVSRWRERAKAER